MAQPAYIRRQRIATTAATLAALPPGALSVQAQTNVAATMKPVPAPTVKPPKGKDK